MGDWTLHQLAFVSLWWCEWSLSVAQRDRLCACWLVALNTKYIRMDTNRMWCRSRSIQISMEEPWIILLKMLKWANTLNWKAKCWSMVPAHSRTPLKIESGTFSFSTFSFARWNHLLNGHYKRNKISITSQIDWCLCSKEIRTPFRCMKEGKKTKRNRTKMALSSHFAFKSACGRIPIRK